MAKATNGEEEKAMSGEEERMWCGHCGVKTLIRREGNAGSVKACDWCGKVLADETGTAEEYNKLFLRLQNFLSESGKRHRRRRRIRKKILN